MKEFAIKRADGWYWTDPDLYPYMFKITAQDWASEFGINLEQGLVKK
jgi:hypothetical protein